VGIMPPAAPQFQQPGQGQAAPQFQQPGQGQAAPQFQQPQNQIPPHYGPLNQGA